MLTEKQIRAERRLLSETDEHLAATFKALGDVNRFRIFRILTDRPQISVSTIAKILGLSLPLTSQHVKVLAQAHLLQKSRAGKRMFSRLDRRNPVVRELVRTIQRTVKVRPLNRSPVIGFAARS